MLLKNLVGYLIIYFEINMLFYQTDAKAVETEGNIFPE